MKTFSIEDLRSIISDIRNSEEKKNLYIILGVFVAVAAIAVGIAAIVIKKHFEERDDDDDFYDDWDCDEDCCDGDCCDCDDEEEKEDEE